MSLEKKTNRTTSDKTEEIKPQFYLDAKRPTLLSDKQAGRAFTHLGFQMHEMMVQGSKWNPRYERRGKLYRSKQVQKVALKETLNPGKGPKQERKYSNTVHKNPKIL